MRDPVQDDFVHPQFNIRVSERRLRCSCGHSLTAHDFEILHAHLVRAVCQRCHSEGGGHHA